MLNLIKLSLIISVIYVFINYEAPKETRETKKIVKTENWRDKQMKEFSKSVCGVNGILKWDGYLYQKNNTIDRLVKCVNGQGFLLRVFKNDYGVREYRIIKYFSE